MRQAGIDPCSIDPVQPIALQTLAKKISASYRDAREDRKLLERSIDLSSREMAELNRCLETERNRLDTLLTATEDCVCTLDNAGCLVWANPAALHVFAGVSAGVSLPEERFSFFENLEALPVTDQSRGNSSRHCRALLLSRTGAKTPISYLLNKITGATADAAAFVVIFRDITAELAYEKELCDAREAAKAGSKAKAELLANVSHEVRTPLHGILGMTQVLLMEGGLNQAQTDCLQNLQTSAEYLLQILNDLLDLSKIEAGRFSMEAIPLQPETLLQQVYQLLAPQARAKGIDLRCRTQPGEHSRTIGDPTRVRQILLNLASNAVKFTEHGFVELALLRTVTGGLVRLVFSVQDSGIGIPKEQHRSIFEAFSQADGSITRRFGGTGLGLAICSRLAQLMGGELTVASEPGRGSTFLFTVPMQAASESQKLQKQEDCAVLRPLRILYAEDNAINQLTGRKMLASKGHTVRIVSNGREAVEAIKNEVFDVILMDHQMPEMSGIEASGKIRALGFTVPIIAASADAMLDDRHKFIAAGMNGFVGKPFMLRDIEREIARVLSPEMLEGSAAQLVVA